jgi:hypothetical protein
MEQCRRANALWLALEHGTVGELDVFELFDAVEMTVDEQRIGEGPEVFCRLQLGRVGWKEVQKRWSGTRRSRLVCPPGPPIA